MTLVEDLEMVNVEDTEKPATPWRPRVITGGKGPSEPPSKNWLSEFPEGTVFTCRHKNNQDVDLNLYCVLHKREDVVLLSWKLPDGKSLDYYVDPVRFSNKFEHVTVLGDIPMAEEQEENNDSRE